MNLNKVSTALSLSAGGKLRNVRNRSSNSNTNPETRTFRALLKSKTWLALLLLPLLGCESAGVLKSSAAKYHSIFFANRSAFSETYTARASQELAAYGLPTVTDTNQAGALECKIEVDQANVWNFRVAISLWDGSNEVAAGTAANHGFGSLLSPTSATDQLFNAALHRLETELQKSGHRKAML